MKKQKIILFTLLFINSFLSAQNTNLGLNTLRNSTSSSNTALGANALSSGTGINPNGVLSGSYNIGIGVQSLTNNQEGEQNIGIGYQSLFSNIGGAGNLGDLNIAIGNFSMKNNTLGLGNTALGYFSLSSNISGNSNVAIGANSIRNSTGNSNVALGSSSGFALASGNSNIFIGNAAGDHIQSGTGNVVIGTHQTTYASLENTIIFSTGSGSERFRINSSGNMGLGTTAPNNKLEINGPTNQSGLRFTNLKSSNTNLQAPNGKVLTVTTNGDVVLTTDQGSGGSTVITGGTNVTVTGNGVTTDPYIISSTATNCNLYSCDGTLLGNRTVTMANNRLMFNTSADGKIYIGNTSTVADNLNFPTSTGNYKLYVEGGILTEKVKVALRSTANWADYVFASDYKLRSLKEVETFITENKHLPGIKSAKTLSKEGLDLAEMQAKQMEKIEELTLYAIEQNKQIEKQSKEIEEQNKNIEELKEQVRVLLEKK